ncbi:MAG: endonuclease/exonuclease/phosphatase [Anaerolineaceae bacterium]|nr:MAG: endonuclease/exonuclease/phosphatase [Anaerolineaceae bacterium]
MPRQYRIAFWNLENLFDIEGSPQRTEKLARTLGSSIKGWTQALLDRKIGQLAGIIRKMNDGRGPDILGIAETENLYVIELLVQALAPLGRNYRIVHHDTRDSRGIDVAFIYDANLFAVPEPLADNVFSHFVMKRTATRDIVHVNFKTVAHGRLLVLMGNHWPSRKGDEGASAAYRAMAGETMAYFHQRVFDIQGKTTPVLAMGDFNDEPFDASLVDYALALRSLQQVLKGINPYFLNLMWPLMGQGIGTYYFDGPIVFDQFLANKNLLAKDVPLRVVPGSVEILRFPEMVKKGAYPEPIPFGGMGKPVNQNGCSDHLPIQVTLVEAD